MCSEPSLFQLNSARMFTNLEIISDLSLHVDRPPATLFLFVYFSFSIFFVRWNCYVRPVFCVYFLLCFSCGSMCAFRPDSQQTSSLSRPPVGQQNQMSSSSPSVIDGRFLLVTPAGSYQHQPQTRLVVNTS